MVFKRLNDKRCNSIAETQMVIFAQKFVDSVVRDWLIGLAMTFVWADQN